LAIASVALCACDPAPRVRVINGTGGFILINQVSRLQQRSRTVAPGGSAALNIDSQGAWRPSVEFHRCRYDYEAPETLAMPARPATDRGIGQWGFVQIGEDLRLYAREPYSRRAASNAGLRGEKQPPGWPLAPVGKTCR
jgi:hypothetical protein